jgi:hypothetical protein
MGNERPLLRQPRVSAYLRDRAGRRVMRPGRADRAREVFLSVLAVSALMLAAGCARAWGAHPIRTYGGFVLNGTSKAPHGMSEWNRWLDQPWLDPGGDRLRFPVADGHGGKDVVGNCLQLFAADRKGLALTQPIDQMLYRGWALNCYAGRLIRDAAAARTSYVAGFRFDRAHVEALPARMRFVISASDARADAGQRMKRFATGAKMTFSNAPDDMYAMITYPDGGTQAISLVARGDFNHDGVQDLLLRSYNRANGGGSYAALAMYIVTRRRAGARLEVVRQVPVMGPGYKQ